MKRLETAILLLSLLVVALHAQDGICKKSDPPTNYVAVGEFNSGDCDDGVNPLANNAWRIEPVRDGITVCALPRYEVMGAKVAELQPCEHVVSDRCSPRLDGQSNAIVLRSPAQCAKRVLPEDLKVNCSASVGLENGKSGYMVAQVTSATCPPPPASNRAGYVHTANAWLARKVDSPSKPDFLAICADDYNIGRSDYIVRRFRNTNCPVNPRVAGAQEGLTGWVIRLGSLPPEKIFTWTWANGEQTKEHYPSALTLCEAFMQDSFKPFGAEWIGYHVAVSYSELCGGQAQKPNSFEVFRDANDLLFADAPLTCMGGSWHQEGDAMQNSNDVLAPEFDGTVNHDWTFSITGGNDLFMKRDDGLVSESCRRDGAWWACYIKYKRGTSEGGPGGPYILSVTSDCKRAHLTTGYFSSMTWFRRIHD